MNNETENRDPVTARSLKDMLWETMKDLRKGRIKPDVVTALTKSANAILKTIELESEVNKQFRIEGMTTDGLQEFVLPKGAKIPAIPMDQEAYEKKILEGKEPSNH